MTIDRRKSTASSDNGHWVGRRSEPRSLTGHVAHAFSRLCLQTLNGWFALSITLRHAWPWSNQNKLYFAYTKYRYPCPLQSLYPPRLSALHAIYERDSMPFRCCVKRCGRLVLLVMGILIALKIALLYVLTFSGGVVVAGTARLPSYPLAVKHPYLSTWVPGNQLLENAATAQPLFWAGQNLTWPVLARVNGETFSLFGMPDKLTNVTAARTVDVRFTSSHTFVQVSAGPALFTLDFFSPVLPGSSDYARQSLPYSYLTINATSTRSYGWKPVDVQILTGIDYTWTAQNGASNLNYSSTGDNGFFEFNNPNEIPFTEVNDMATYGAVVFATDTTSSSTAYLCGAADSVYQTFIDNGYVSSGKTCSGTDLAAFTKDLGGCGQPAYISTIADTWPGWGGSTRSATFAVGFDRADAILYLNQVQSGYYRSQWPTIPEAVDFFLSDYQAVYATSLNFDAEVRSRAQSVSSDWGSEYADIVEASVRQTFGALELTIPADDLNAEPSVFLKEISSDGNVNTVDVIYQSWPIFISLNPEYIKLLFEPILSYSVLPSGQTWPKPWLIHDIGTHYPNATGHNDGVAEQMPLFETSTLFILLYAYQKYTGDKGYAKQYQQLLVGYADYLATHSLYPASQLISVDAIGITPNQTALAMQSVMGLKAASLITGNSTYADLATSFATKIYDQGLGLDGPTPERSTHFTYNYGVGESWNVLFASFSDVILDLNTFPSAAWEMQSRWYATRLQVGGLPFAGPRSIDRLSEVKWGLTDWNIVVAAVSSASVQEAIVKTTHTFLTNGENSIPFGTKYNVEGNNIGLWLGDEARSTVGSHFAILALQQGVWGTSF